MPVYNPIFLGSAWAQAFDLLQDFVQAGNAFRAELRPAMKWDELDAEVSTIGGIVVDNDRLFVTLTAEQTAQMQPSAVGDRLRADP